MAKYSGKGPISKQDLQRAKLEAKRARAAKMSNGTIPVTQKKIKPYGTKKTNTRLWIIIGAAAAAVAIIGMVVFLVASQRPSEAELLGFVTDGVYAETTTIEGVDVSGLTLSEARTALSDILKAKLDDAAIQFTFNGESHTETAMTLGFVTDVEDVLVDAMLYEKSGTYFDRQKKLKTAQSEGVRYAVQLIADQDMVAKAVESIAAKYQVDAVEPDMSFNPDAETEEATITWSDEVEGLTIDQPAFVSAILAAVESGNFNLNTIDTLVITPEHTKADMAGSVVKLSEYTSFFGYGTYDDDDRVFNIKLMSQTLSGNSLEPGEIFSINETTGERTEEKGWKAGGTIRKGVLVEDLGGGVCQVSSTLYNAVLLADLGIVERHNHTYPSDYINKVGRFKVGEYDYVTRNWSDNHVAVDATIDYPSKDFKFINTLSETIYFVIYVDDEAQTVTAAVYGPPRTDGYQVVIRTLLHKTIAPTEVTTRLIAENGVAPSGAYVYIGKPLSYPARRDGQVWWTYKYYYKEDYDFKTDPDPLSWVGYNGTDENSGEKYRLTLYGTDTYIDSNFPAIAGVTYYNPSDPAASDLPGYIPPDAATDGGGDGTATP